MYQRQLNFWIRMLQVLWIALCVYDKSTCLFDCCRIYQYVTFSIMYLNEYVLLNDLQNPIARLNLSL